MARDHVAIMKKSWGLLPKILSGEKTIESRWYVNRIAPWNRIAAGDMVYFKDSGEPVTARAEVSEVRQFSGLNREKIRSILEEYGSRIGMEPTEETINRCAAKNYCILVFLKNTREVTPFKIDKTGYGSACAWLMVDDIAEMRVEKARG